MLSKYKKYKTQGYAISFLVYMVRFLQCDIIIIFFKWFLKKMNEVVLQASETIPKGFSYIYFVKKISILEEIFSYFFDGGFKL